MRHISLQILLNIPKWEENDHQNSNLSHNGRKVTKTLHYADQGGKQSEHLTRIS